MTRTAMCKSIAVFYMRKVVNKMNKPISMSIKETKDKIVAACNESGLHIAILDLIMQELYSEVHNLAIQQSSEEKKAYSKMIEESNKEEKKETETTE